jgi:hypothetical protein
VMTRQQAAEAIGPELDDVVALSTASSLRLVGGLS